MKYYLMLCATVALIMLDYHIYDVVESRGGFCAWTESDCFYQVALGYLFFFHVMYGIGAWVFYEVIKEK